MFGLATRTAEIIHQVDQPPKLQSREFGSFHGVNLDVRFTISVFPFL